MTTTNFKSIDPVTGSKDLGDQFVTDEYLISRFTGKRAVVVGWGNYGANGDGTTTNRNSPGVQLANNSQWLSISMGGNYWHGIKSNGTLWACGYNTGGNLGNGVTTWYSSPVQIGSLSNWAQVSSYSTTLAIKTDGTLWAWGANNSGNMGNNTTISYSSPVQIGSLTDWAYVVSGSISAAIKQDGSLWVWGPNNYGQLGDGSFTARSSPVQVGTLKDWTRKIAVSNASVHVIKKNGTLWAWGYNGSGLLGSDSGLAYYLSPTQIGSQTTWKSVSGGSNVVHLVRSDGTLWATGTNFQGVLGINNNNDNTATASPIQIGSQTNWRSVGTGSSTAVAIKTDGSLWSWGYASASFQTFHGTASRSSPVQSGSLTDWVLALHQSSNSIALRYDDLY